MIPARVLALALFTSALQGGSAQDLRVLRHSPDREGSANSIILVTFDRPVADELDRAPQAEGLISIEPAIAGQTEWRDPVTLRFTPARLLAAGTEYTVTVRNTFTTEAGDRLPEPYRFAFRVTQPRILTSSLVALGDAAVYLDTLPRLALLVSGPGDYAAVLRGTFLELGPTCGGERVVRLVLLGDRAVGDRDPWEFRRWWYEGESEKRELRRVIDVRPERPLPRNCPGSWVYAPPAGGVVRWGFHTFRPLRLAAARCGHDPAVPCPTGPLILDFTTPVRGSAVAAALRLTPTAKITWADTATERISWTVAAPLTPRTPHVIVLDSTLTDVFGQRLGPQPGAIVRTTGYAPAVDYLSGRLLVERAALRSLTVTTVNVDTIVAEFIPVPDSALVPFLARPWGYEELLARLTPFRRDTLVVPQEPDRAGRVGLRIPVFDAQRPGTPALVAVRVTSPRLKDRPLHAARVALVQVTDLAVHARIGSEEGTVWVVGASDGQPRAGAAVTLVDARGNRRAQASTDAQGLARLSIATPVAPAAAEGGGEQADWYLRSFDGYVNVVLGTDRAVVPVSDADWELNPWRFNVAGAWGAQRVPVAAALFTERDIYRPGETVHVKAILRRGSLGALRVPPPTDSVRLVFADREGGVLAERTFRPNEFGTAADTLSLGRTLPLGAYAVRAQARVNGEWQTLATTGYRVAEYRPPEFLADIRTADTSRLAGDTLSAVAEGRYLFGAPMAGAAVRWTASRSTVWPWELKIPGTDGFAFTEARWWWEEPSSYPAVFAEGTDSLDDAGARAFWVALPAPGDGQAYRVALTATVTDVNRQASSATASALVHPAAFYLGVKAASASWFWRAGEPQDMEVIAVRSDGTRLTGVRARGVLIRREWHRVRRERDGYGELVGEWVADTVMGCEVTTAADQPARCRVTPAAGGQYTFRVTASDAAGRRVAAGFYRWATGRDWVPWFDDTQLKMDVVPDRERYQVGDTARVLFASPFTNAEAWVTVEREGLLEQRRLRITSGSTTLAFPITEAHAPNAFVSIVVSRGRVEPPGKPDDPGRPALRVGYAQLRVEPEAKRLSVTVSPLRDEYRPGDTARVRLAVRDAGRRGRRAEVTLWAVDEGVLALTGYRTPDPVSLLYAPRGLGMRLASNLVAVAPQVAEQGAMRLVEKGLAPGGGGGMDVEGILRSRFASTAFFLASVTTDAQGNGEAAARLPDNLTTFRVMAVAVTVDDRYGSGESPMLVTRPLLARPALPRFVRAGDRFEAGAVINHRLGRSAAVAVETEVRGIRLAGDRRRTVTLDRGRAQEVRFPFTAEPGDSVAFRFKVSSGAEADAVEARLPVRPTFHVRAHTVAGVLTDTATVTFALPEGTDPAASRLEVRLGVSPLDAIRTLNRRIRVYPYYCTEQVSSAARPLLALLRAGRSLDDSTLAPRTARHDVEQAVQTLLLRQRSDGGIGYWGLESWTSPWLTAYAGQVLIEARDLGFAVPDSAVSRVADYLRAWLRQPRVQYAWMRTYYAHELVTHWEHTAAIAFLARAGEADVAAENRLLAVAGRLPFSGRAALAEVLGRRGRRADARGLLEPIWASIRVEGRRAILPDSAWYDDWFYFPSVTRGGASLLAATVAVDPAHPLIGPLIASLVGAARGQSWWNTVDVGAAVPALAALESTYRAAGDRGIRVLAGGRPLRLGADSTVALDAAGTPGSRPGLAIRLEAARGGPPVFYALTVHEVPLTQPRTPDDGGIAVERWYERLDDGRPVTSVAAGELVRVKLRITVKADRQFVILDDPLPAGLEAVDVSLRTQGEIPGVTADDAGRDAGARGLDDWIWWGDWWSPFSHREIRDDRVVYAATRLRPGAYFATYVARATTPGTFVRPPTHAEEMYNPSVHGRTEGGTFTVTAPGR